MQTERSWDLEAVLLLTARLFISIALGMLVVALLPGFIPQLTLSQRRFSGFLISTLAFQGAGLVLTHFFIRDHDLPWSQFLGFGKPNFIQALLLGVATGALVLPGVILFNNISEILLTYLQGQPELQPTVQVFQLSVSPVQRVCFGIAAIVVAPVCEEILFRGILYRVVKQFGFPRLALIGSSLLFGLIHFNPMSLVPLSFLALVLAALYDQTDNLVAPIVAHAFFNAVNFCQLLISLK